MTSSLTFSSIQSKGSTAATLTLCDLSRFLHHCLYVALHIHSPKVALVAHVIQLLCLVIGALPISLVDLVVPSLAKKAKVGEWPYFWKKN